MKTMILIEDKEILGIVARHLARHNATSLRSARWIGAREIAAALLPKSQRAKSSAPAADKRKTKMRLPKRGAGRK